MTRLTDLDWDLLEQIDDGEAVNLPPESAVRLMAAQFILLRHDRTPLITGLGRDAVLRRQYNFAPPSPDGPRAHLPDEASS